MVRRAKNPPVLAGEIVVTSPSTASFPAKSGGLGPYEEGSPLLSTDDAVLWQAGVLRSAIEAARAEGYVVQMPFRIEDLDRIVISATAKAAPTT